MKNKFVIKGIEKAGSQKKLAQNLNVTQEAVHRWLYQTLPDRRIIQLAHFLNIPIEKVLEEEEKRRHIISPIPE